MSTSWNATRRSLLTAMGLTPLALSGCIEGEHASRPTAMDQLAPPMVLALAGPLDTGASLTVDIAGAPPFQRVWLLRGDTAGAGPCPPQLLGGCLDVTSPVVVGSAMSDVLGGARIDILLPYDLPDGEVVPMQAVALAAVGTPSLSNVLSPVTTHPTRTCGEHPFLDASTVFSLYDTLACGPLPAQGCPPVSAITQRMETRLLDYIMGGGGGFPVVDLELRCFEDTIEDACCYGATVTPLVVIGRPFTVDGEARCAATVASDGWSSAVQVDTAGLPRRHRRALASEWSKTAAGEHASVASFARFALQLMRLGAPADLVSRATRAMADEIRHAADAYAVASSFAAQPLGPSTLATDGATDEGASVTELVVSAVREGCIAETIAACQAAEAARLCTDETIADVLTHVARDEQRHAELAWAFVRWALEAHPEVRGAVAAAFAETTSPPEVAATPHEGLHASYGVLSTHHQHRVAREVLEAVVRPCARQLLQAAAEERAAA